LSARFKDKFNSEGIHFLTELVSSVFSFLIITKA
jgi:hypothetical protein